MEQSVFDGLTLFQKAYQLFTVHNLKISKIRAKYAQEYQDKQNGFDPREVRLLMEEEERKTKAQAKKEKKKKAKKKIKAGPDMAIHIYQGPAPD